MSLYAVYYQINQLGIKNELNYNDSFHFCSTQSKLNSNEIKLRIKKIRWIIIHFVKI